LVSQSYVMAEVTENLPHNCLALDQNTRTHTKVGVVMNRDEFAPSVSISRRYKSIHYKLPGDNAAKCCILPI